MKKIFFVLLIIGFNSSLFAQIKTLKEEANEYVLEAIKLMDNEEPDKAIQLIEKALKLVPNHPTYLYEMGFAYYIKKDYKKAKNIFEDLTQSDDAEDLHFKMLGNSYDLLGKPEKAVDAYKKGLKKFPNSGKIYFELGIMSMAKENYEEAVEYWEKGIEVEPTHPSNYYWATKLFSGSNEKIWALLYGEVFMNLERNSKRTEEVSKILFEVYKTAITPKSDTAVSVDLTKKGVTITIKDPKDLEKRMSEGRLLPFEGNYVMALSPASIIIKEGTSLDAIYLMRKGLLDFWFNQFKNDKKYPNVLLDYQKQILEAGHFETYSYWLHSQGNEKEFEAWYSKNEQKFKDFGKWFNQNQLQLSPDYKLYRLQYD